MSHVLDPTLRDLRTKRQVTANELDSAINRFSRSPHQYLGEATMTIQAHPADILARPSRVAKVGFLSLHVLPNGNEVIIYRQEGGMTALGNYDRRTRTCVTLAAMRFVDTFVPETASAADQEIGLAFVATIVKRIEMFNLTA